MASSKSNFEKPADIKIILLGDSAVGKSKLIERFLLNDFVSHQLSTYALTLYRHQCNHPTKPGKKITVEFWDTAGQERFHSMHPSYYISAHACILCFDMTRKITYKHLDTWYDQLSAYRGHTIPIIIVANKVDMDPSRARKSFGFVERRREERRSFKEENGMKVSESDEEELPLFFCSASDGSNVVAAFKEAVRRAVAFKEGGEVGGTFVDEVLNFIREEEERGDAGLFSKDKEFVNSLANKFESGLSVGDSLNTLRGSDTSVVDVKEKHPSDRRAYNPLDSDEEDEIAMAKNLARVKDMRKVNSVQ